MTITITWHWWYILILMYSGAPLVKMYENYNARGQFMSFNGLLTMGYLILVSIISVSLIIGHLI